MRPATLSHLLLAVLAALAPAACIGGRATPGTQHHVLNPVVDVPSGGPASPEARRVVGVGPISMPAYLDRPQMVTRPAPDQIEISEFDQWGEPLRDGITRVVAVNLARLLPESLIVAFPWRSTEKIQSQIILEVVQMDGPAAGNVTLDVRWRALDPSGRQVAVRVLRLTEPAGPGAGATAAAMSRALGTLSRDIAQQLRTTEGSFR